MNASNGKNKWIVALFMLACAWNVFFSVASAQEIDVALAKVEHAREGISSNELEWSLNTFRNRVAPGDQGVWLRLRRVMMEDAVPVAVRVELMKLSCQKADEAIARDILSIATDWINAMRSSDGTLEVEDPIHIARRAILVGGVKWGYSCLENALQDQSPLLNLLVYWKDAEAIANNPAPLHQKRQAALALITSDKRRNTPNETLLTLLDSSIFPQLRALVRSSTDPATFHYHAAASLAYLGDNEILADLRARIAPFESIHRNARGSLDRFIWQIEIQHPPSRLLEFIASTDLDMRSVLLREPSIRLALFKGIEKSQIRQAVLQFVANYAATNDITRNSRIRSLKRLCVDSGILQSGDLPSIATFPKLDLGGCGPEPLRAGQCHILPTALGVAVPSSQTSQPIRIRPARQPWWPKKWKANEANRPAFNAWLEGQRQVLASLSGDESLRLIKQKMCELDLLAPDECARLGLATPASQPTGGPGTP
jgi:hypothetical protein